MTSEKNVRSSSTAPRLRLETAPLAVGIILLSVMLCALYTSTSQAQTPRLFFSKKLTKKTSTPYRVRKGDNLYAIIKAQGYPEEIIPEILRQILELNPSLSPGRPIHPGQSIRLPDVHGTPEAVSRAVKPAHGTQRRKTGQTRYTIRAGDTLLRVLQKETGLTSKQITQTYLASFLAHNPDIKNINRIQQGQSVLIPSPSQSEHTPEYEGLSISQAKKYTRAFLQAMGFSFTQGKDAFFPQVQNTWLRINLHTTPLVRTPWGTSVLLIPRDSGSHASRISEQTTVSHCRVPKDWNPRKVIQALARTFPQSIFLCPDDGPIERTMGTMRLSLQTDIMVEALWKKNGEIYCMQVLSGNKPAYPVFLSSLLHEYAVSLVQWQTGPDNILIPVKSPRINAGDIYIPTLSPEELRRLAANKNGATFMVPALPPMPERIPQKTDITLHWGQGKRKISLAAAVLGIRTEDHSVIILDQTIKAPYLVALLGMKGLECYTLEEPTP